MFQGAFELCTMGDGLGERRICRRRRVYDRYIPAGYGCLRSGLASGKERHVSQALQHQPVGSKMTLNFQNMANFTAEDTVHRDSAEGLRSTGLPMIAACLFSHLLFLVSSVLFVSVPSYMEYLRWKYQSGAGNFSSLTYWA